MLAPKSILIQLVRMTDGDRGELQRYLVADQGAAALQHGVPADAPVPAVDGRRALEAGPEGALLVVSGAGQLEVHGDRLGRAADGQVAGEPEAGLAELLGSGRGEGDGRVVRGVEKGPAQVVVAPGAGGLDARRLDREPGAGLGRVFAVQAGSARELRELPPHRGEDRLADHK